MRSIMNLAALLFLLSEILNVVLNRSKKSKVKIRKDRLSLIFLWSVIIISTTASGFLAAFFPIRERLFFLETVGISIFAVGLIIRWAAIFQLGKMFTVDVAISDSHQIKDTGLYRYLRHPSYFGLILEFFGFSFLYNSWIPLLTINIPILIVLIYRIYIEESLLISYFGKDYMGYIQKVKYRIIPFIW